MSMVSLKFLGFINIVFLAYFLTPKKIKWAVLLLSSYIFYALSSTWMTVFIVTTTIIVYISAKMITAQSKYLKSQKKLIDKSDFKELKKVIKKKKKIIMLVCLFVNLGILVVLKYTNFLLGNVGGIANLLGIDFKINAVTWVLPLGISYYTLMAISYLVDVYYGKYEADDNFIKVALYLSFFPYITEGPIGKYDKLSAQLYEPHKFDYENFKYGGTLVIIGFLKKLVIADRAALFVNEVFQNYTSAGGFITFLAIVLYTVQIYAEFSGCMDIAMGIAKVLGIDLEANFKRPFFSLSIAEFWRRWHITLGAWLRDYVFYPVSLSNMNMNVGKWARAKFSENMSSFIQMAFPLFFVWFSNGVWHGASWKYILYGLYYYIIMMIGLLCKPLSDKLISKLNVNVESAGFKLFQMLRTVFFVLIGMALFRSHSTLDAIKMIGSIFTKKGNNLLEYGMNKGDFVVVFVCVMCMLIIGILHEKGKDVYKWINNSLLPIRYMVYIILIVTIVVFGIYGEGYDAASFIYGQF